jgi:hypothetical protein
MNGSERSGLNLTPVLNTKAFPVVLLCVSLLLEGCGINWNKAETPHDVVGRYVYKYGSGQVESWTFNDDMTYREDLYASEPDLIKNAPPLFSNTQTWHFDGTVTMDRPLVWFDLKAFRDNYADPLKKPVQWNSNSGYWSPPVGSFNAGIEIFSSQKYILVRINDPGEIDKIDLK